MYILALCINNAYFSRPDDESEEKETLSLKAIAKARKQNAQKSKVLPSSFIVNTEKNGSLCTDLEHKLTDLLSIQKHKDIQIFDLNSNLTKLQQKLLVSANYGELLAFELNSEKHVVTEKSQFVSELEAELDSIRKQKLSVSADFERAKSKLIQQSEELSNFRKEFEDKRFQSEKLRFELANKTEELEKCRVQSVTNSSRQTREYITLQLQLSALNKSISTLTHDLDKAFSNIKRVNAELNISKSALSKKQHVTETLLIELAAVRLVSEKSVKNISELVFQLNAKDRVFEEKNDELAAANLVNEEKTQNISRLLDQIAQCKHASEKAKQHVNDTVNSLAKSYDRKLSITSFELSAAKLSNENCLQNMSRLLLQLTKQEQTLEQIQYECNETNQLLVSTQKMYVNNNEIAANCLLKLNDTILELVDSKQKRSKTFALLQTLQQTLSDVKNELNFTKVRESLSNSRQALAENSNLELSRNVTALSQSYTHSEKTIANLSKNVNVLKQSLLSTEKEISLCLISKQTHESINKRIVENYTSIITLLNKQVNISQLQIQTLQYELQFKKIIAENISNYKEEDAREPFSLNDSYLLSKSNKR